MFITLDKIGGMHFRLFGTNGFHVKAKSERFTWSFGRLRQNIAPKSVSHVHHDYISSFNQSKYWFVALSLTFLSSNLKLYYWAVASTTEPITTTPQIKNLIVRTRKTARGVCMGHALEQFCSFFCKTTTWNFYTCGLDDSVNIQQ